DAAAALRAQAAEGQRELARAATPAEHGVEIGRISLVAEDEQPVADRARNFEVAARAERQCARRAVDAAADAIEEIGMVFEQIRLSAGVDDELARQEGRFA